MMSSSTARHASEPDIDLGQTTEDTAPEVEGEPVVAGSGTMRR
jgi:hypothetical protein